MPSPSPSSCPGLASAGQLSHTSPTTIAVGILLTGIERRTGSCRNPPDTGSGAAEAVAVEIERDWGRRCTDRTHRRCRRSRRPPDRGWRRRGSCRSRRRRRRRPYRWRRCRRSRHTRRRTRRSRRPPARGWRSSGQLSSPSHTPSPSASAPSPNAVVAGVADAVLVGILPGPDWSPGQLSHGSPAPSPSPSATARPLSNRSRESTAVSPTSDDAGADHVGAAGGDEAQLRKPVSSLNASASRRIREVGVGELAQRAVEGEKAKSLKDDGVTSPVRSSSRRR